MFDRPEGHENTSRRSFGTSGSSNVQHYNMLISGGSGLHRTFGMGYAGVRCNRLPNVRLKPGINRMQTFTPTFA